MSIPETFLALRIEFEVIRSTKLGACNVKFILKFEMVYLHGDNFLGKAQKLLKTNELKLYAHFSEIIRNPSIIKYF